MLFGTYVNRIFILSCFFSHFPPHSILERTSKRVRKILLRHKMLVYRNLSSILNRVRDFAHNSNSTRRSLLFPVIHHPAGPQGTATVLQESPATLPDRVRELPDRDLPAHPDRAKEPPVPVREQQNQALALQSQEQEYPLADRQQAAVDPARDILKEEEVQDPEADTIRTIGKSLSPRMKTMPKNKSNSKASSVPYLQALCSASNCQVATKSSPTSPAKCASVLSVSSSEIKSAWKCLPMIRRKPVLRSESVNSLLLAYFPDLSETSASHCGRFFVDFPRLFCMIRNDESM